MPLRCYIIPRLLPPLLRSAIALANGDLLTSRISFVSREKLKGVPRTYAELIPDLVIEIKSAFDQLAPLQEKIQRFLQLGVRVALLINPDDRTVSVYRPNSEVIILTDGDNLTVPELLPEWAIAISQLWS